MSLFKRKKEKVVEPKAPEVNQEKKKPTVVEKKTRNNETGILLGVLKRSHITEKASASAAENKYIFAVSSDANKNQIKQDVETKFRVKVDHINVINLPHKERKRGAIIGWKPGIKKAIVTIKEGQKIEIQ